MADPVVLFISSAHPKVASSLLHAPPTVPEGLPLQRALRGRRGSRRTSGFWAIADARRSSTQMSRRLSMRHGEGSRDRTPRQIISWVGWATRGLAVELRRESPDKEIRDASRKESQYGEMWTQSQTSLKDRTFGIGVPRRILIPYAACGAVVVGLKNRLRIG